MNIDSSNDLIPSCNKPLPKPMFIQIYMCHRYCHKELIKHQSLDYVMISISIVISELKYISKVLLILFFYVDNQTTATTTHVLQILAGSRTSIGLVNGFAPNRRQAIIWRKADPIQWRIYAALGGDELIRTHVPLIFLHWHKKSYQLSEK